MHLLMTLILKTFSWSSRCLWPDAQCMEGYCTKTCTTTATTEGYHSFKVIGVDDDLAQTEADIDILFTNIAPQHDNQSV